MNYTKVMGTLAAGALAVMWAMPASAQASRTWISGVGDDVNPCSRTAPCKTWPGAISKTAAGGEIDVLDPGGFGAVTVVKAITLDGGGGIGGMVGSILIASGNGITVNAGAADRIKVRNMSINGIIQVSGSSSLDGIRFIAGGSLIVEHVAIFGMGGVSGTNAGVSFEPNGAAKLNMLDVEIQHGNADGVLVKPQAGGSAIATLNLVSAMSNGGFGLRVDSSSISAGTGNNVTATNSMFSGNVTGAGAITPGATVASQLLLTNSVVSGNSGAGTIANGANASVRIGGDTFGGNGTGVVFLATGTMRSFGDNYFAGNGADGTLSNVTPLTKF